MIKTKKHKIHLIAAARPNFMKIAPLHHQMKREEELEPVIVHTGQHYDINMSDAFFIDLGMPQPNIHLGVGSGSHAEQTGKVMIAYEKVLLKDAPSMVIVVGDVNSTLAATLAAVKLGIKVAHLEAGLRSFDRSMPEEINRIVTDSLADILLTPSKDGDQNLINEGVDENKIFRVGNIMIDSLEMLRKTIISHDIYKRYELKKSDYGMVTLHRPSNVDKAENLNRLCDKLIEISEHKKLIFPIHPRTLKNLSDFGLLPKIETCENIIITEPFGYIQFMNLIFNCGFVITDSGGIQEETTYLGIPCFTMRPNTERPVTISEGTNQLCTIENIVEKFKNTNLYQNEQPVIELWDGITASRVVDVIKKQLNGN